MIPKDLSPQEQEAYRRVYERLAGEVEEAEWDSWGDGFEAGWLAASEWIKARVVAEGERV